MKGVPQWLIDLAKGALKNALQNPALRKMILEALKVEVNNLIDQLENDPQKLQSLLDWIDSLTGKQSG